MTNSINRRAVLSNLSRRLGPVFAEYAAAHTEAQEGTQRAKEGTQNVNPVATHPGVLNGPSRGYKPAHGGYPGV